MELPYITLDQLLSFDPCWAASDEGMRRLEYYNRKLGGKANALDILRLRRIPARDRLWTVLREDMIPAAILHEFGCWCAEQALLKIANPDPRSVQAIEVKRRWIRGEAADDELAAARDAAWDAARAAAWDAARAAARAAAWAAARDAAWAAAWAAARAAQIKHLIEMLEEMI